MTTIDRKGHPDRRHSPAVCFHARVRRKWTPGQSPGPRPPWTALAAAVVLIALTVAYAVQLRKDMTDFGVCFRAGQRVMAGETLYRPSDGHLQYKYAPVSAMFYAAFTCLPYEWAKAAWFAVELLLLAACFLLAYRVLPEPRRRVLPVLGLAFLVLGKFIGREFELGQVNGLILFLILAALAEFKKGADGKAGMLWCLSLFFKPYALIFLPYFILKKRVKVLASGGAGLAAGLAVPVVVFGWAGNVRVIGEWARTLSQSTPGLLKAGDNASLYAFLAKHIGRGGTAAALFAGTAAVLAAAMLWMMDRARKRGISGAETLDFAFLLVLVPLLSPLGWYYNYLYGLPAVVIILNSFRGMRLAWRYAAAADLLIIGGTLREVLGKTAFRAYTHNSLVALNFLILLAVLIHLRAKKIA